MVLSIQQNNAGIKRNELLIHTATLVILKIITLSGRKHNKRIHSFDSIQIKL